MHKKLFPLFVAMLTSGGSTQLKVYASYTEKVFCHEGEKLVSRYCTEGSKWESSIPREIEHLIFKFWCNFVKFEKIASLNVHASTVHAICPYLGSLLSVSNHKNGIDIFDVWTRESCRFVERPTQDNIWSLARSEAYFILGQEGGIIRVYDVKEESWRAPIEGQLDSIDFLSFFGNTHLLFAASRYNRFIESWDLSDLRPTLVETKEVHKMWVSDICCSKEQHLITVGCDDEQEQEGSVKIWNLNKAKKLELSTSFTISNVNVHAVCCEGETLFVGCTDNTIRIFDMEGSKKGAFKTSSCPTSICYVEDHLFSIENGINGIQIFGVTKLQ